MGLPPGAPPPGGLPVQRTEGDDDGRGEFGIVDVSPDADYLTVHGLAHRPIAAPPLLAAAS